MVSLLICILVGYACGSVLTADIVARHKTGRSAFLLGDGNPGMANIGHELGTGAALVCLAGDILKTLLPVLALSRVFASLGWTTVAAWTGLGATLGHIFPLWNRLKGGKGVTTIASTIILMHPLWGILAGVVGVLAIFLTGYLSAAAVIAMAFYTIAMLVLGSVESAIVSIVFLALTLYAHGSKLRGILDGTTRRASLADKFSKANKANRDDR